MMDAGLLLRGTILGFSIAAPVGPIGVLVIRESMTTGRKAGLLTGLGAATADGLYGLVGGLGLTAVSTLLVSHATALRIVGGLFMLWLGVRTFFSVPSSTAAIGDARAGGRIYLTGLLLTVTNPMTILSFAAMFAGMGLGSEMNGSSTGIVALVAGVLVGSSAWWLVLSSAASLAGRKLTAARLRWVNRCSGLIVAAFGTLALVAA
jgi:threonine/homoserine/homoserine lactone efflux protein